MLIAVAIIGVLALVILALLIGIALREEDDIDRGRGGRRQDRGNPPG